MCIFFKKPKAPSIDVELQYMGSAIDMAYRKIDALNPAEYRCVTDVQMGLFSVYHVPSSKSRVVSLPNDKLAFWESVSEVIDELVDEVASKPFNIGG